MKRPSLFCPCNMRSVMFYPLFKMSIFCYVHPLVWPCCCCVHGCPVQLVCAAGQIVSILSGQTECPAFNFGKVHGKWLDTLFVRGVIWLDNLNHG